eukprot:maker-scaffold685_size112133-snap-gene-0.19 protein:Tk02077 transcript:maker-scaffold685_size112133-snap-gene-0.19-mRNA-1 annotation:"predicted protein"
MRNFIAVSFVTLLLVLGSSQDPRTRFTPRTNDDRPTITKNLVSGQCLNVTSPNYPDNYPNTARCTMVITIPTSKRLNLQLLKDSFDFESKDGVRCVDFLELENILTADDDVDINDRFCEMLTDDKALFSKSAVASVTLKFEADGSITGKGFLATLCVP